MKKYFMLFIVAFLSTSCDGQSKLLDSKNDKDHIEDPRGHWSVNKEFDEDGNLIKYDSTYYWSSHDEITDFSSINKDSLIQSFEERFFSDLSYFDNPKYSPFTLRDSIFRQKFFSEDFFESEFGEDYMNFDKLREEMISKQMKLFEKYHRKLDEI